MRISRNRKLMIIIFYVICFATFTFVFWPVARIKLRNVAYLTRPLWDNPGNIPKTQVTHYYSKDVDITDLCRLHGWTVRDLNESVTVIDAIIFNGELDILEIRIRELWDVVDYFVVVEADRSFTGSRKPLFLKEELESPDSKLLFAKNKLIHEIYYDLRKLKDNESPFKNEISLRDHMTSVIKRVPYIKLGDLVIVSDADEIPYRHTIELLKSCQGYPSGIHLKLKEYVYSFEFATKTLSWRSHVEIYSRNFEYGHGKRSNYILTNAGWHCSFCFRTLSQFIFKMKSYSHNDRVTHIQLLEPKEIQMKICEGKNLYDMYHEAYTWSKLIEKPIIQLNSAINLPGWIINNPERFKFLLPGGCVREDD